MAANKCKHRTANAKFSNIAGRELTRMTSCHMRFRESFSSCATYRDCILSKFLELLLLFRKKPSWKRSFWQFSSCCGLHKGFYSVVALLLTCVTARLQTPSAPFTPHPRPSAPHRGARIGALGQSRVRTVLTCPRCYWVTAWRTACWRR